MTENTRPPCEVYVMQSSTGKYKCTLGVSPDSGGYLAAWMVISIPWEGQAPNEMAKQKITNLAHNIMRRMNPDTTYWRWINANHVPRGPFSQVPAIVVEKAKSLIETGKVGDDYELTWAAEL